MKGSSLVLDVRPSRYLALATAGIHLSASTGVLLADLPGLWRVGLLAVIIAGYVVTNRKVGKSVLRCDLDEGLAEWVGDEWLGVVLSSETMIWPWLVVLRYRPALANKQVTKIILPDCLGKDDFRWLRVWLRWRSAKAVAAWHDA